MLIISLALAGGAAAPSPARLAPQACDLHQRVVAAATTTTTNRALVAGLEDALECRTGTGLPVEGTFTVFQRLADLVRDTTVLPEARAHRALLVGTVAQRFDQASLVGNMVGVALELEGQLAIDAVWADLDPTTRDIVSAAAFELREGPTPDLFYERVALREMVAQDWRMQLVAPWCLAEHDRATVALAPLLATQDAAAMDAWSLANPRDGWMPWTQAGQMCRAGIPEVLADWTVDRERADAGWLRISHRCRYH